MKQSTYAKLRRTLDKQDLSPKHLKFIEAYILSGGNQTIAGQAIGVKRSQASHIMKQRHFLRKVRRALRYIGLSPNSVFKPLVKILKRKGDYHYDFNKLRAIDIYCKLFGLYAPKKIEHGGKVTHTKEHKIDATFKLLKLLKVEGYEAKDRPKIVAEENN